MELNEIIQLRKEKSAALEAKKQPLFDSLNLPRQDIARILADFQEAKGATAAGRVIAKRQHGKAMFYDLNDGTGKIQLYLKADIVDQEAFALLDDIDIADILWVKGELFKTHTGESSIKVQELKVLVKALRPLPEKWHGLKDVDIRYRQRYLDLIANKEVRDIFLVRAQVIRGIRDFLDQRGFLEVETPMMHTIPGGAAGRPFKTFHNEYGMDLYLRIAPELYLKRLLVAGLGRVYEINRSFRNEGVSARHNPEFTMLEVYEAYSSCAGMMQLCEELISGVAQKALGKQAIVYQGKDINLAPPWKKVSFAELVRDRFDIGPDDPPKEMLGKLQKKGFAKDAGRLSRSQIAKIIEEILEQDIGSRATFVTDYFTSLCPLAKTRKDNPLISERFELYIAGIEVANAYSELNNPIEQRRRFEEEVRELTAGEAKNVDDEYILALEHGMPPAGGLGIGIDRLVMLLTNQPTIREVILFPLLRPEGK